MDRPLMVTYEITAIVEPGLVSAYERYMRERHVPDLMATGCFHPRADECGLER